MTDAKLKGGCLCGQVRFELTESPAGVVDCHCGMCRRWHGGVGSYVSVPWSALRWTQGEEALVWYRSSPEASRAFCRHCGSSLAWRHDVRKRDADVTAGALDQPTGLKTLKHIYVADKADYTALTDGLPQFAASSAPHLAPTPKP